MTTSSSPGDFVDATHRMVRAVAKNMLGGLPRLRYARVMSVDPIVLRYLDDRSEGTAAVMRPYSPSPNDIAVVASFAGYVMLIGTTVPSPGGGNGGLPVASVIEWSGGSSRPIPAGFLLCDGAAHSRTKYANLFREIGVTYGNGDGSTTFNVPNRRGRVAVGLDSGVARFDTIGETGGAVDVTLNIDQMPTHEHGPHEAYNFWGYNGTGSGEGTWNPTNATGVAGFGHTGSTGGGLPHENMPPYLVQRFLIKT